MTFLRYFAPIVFEAKKRNIKCNFFVGMSGKYNCPISIKKNLEVLKQFCLKNNVEIFDIREIRKKKKEPVILIEGVGTEFLNEDLTSISITYMTDFRKLMSKYYNLVDYVVFPSKSFAKCYNLESEKNLYFGSPKYDFDYCGHTKETTKKLNLEESKKYALLIYPKLRDIKKCNVKAVIEDLRSLGLEVLIKIRGKESILNSFGCKSFSDETWFPHTTMELMSISDVVVSFGSTSIKESIMLKKPIFSFPVKSHKHLPFLYNFSFIKESNVYEKNSFVKDIKFLLEYNHNSDFEMCFEDHLFKSGESSKKIVDFIENKFRRND